MRRVFQWATTGLGALTLAGAVLAQEPIVQPSDAKVVPSLTVRGEADLHKPADQLRLNIGVVTENTEAAAALKENSDAMAAIVKAVEKVGLEEREFQTGRFQVRPVYAPRPRQADAGWRPHITGYEVSNSIALKTKKLDLAGKLIEAANQAGANSIDNIRFDLAQRRTYRSEAISAATAHAIADARTLAEASEVRLVRILSINLDQAQARPPVPVRYARGMAAAVESDSPTPITPGEVTVSASVTVVYEIDSRR